MGCWVAEVASRLKLGAASTAWNPDAEFMSFKTGFNEFVESIIVLHS